jgi:hypothetical protein
VPAAATLASPVLWPVSFALLAAIGRMPPRMAPAGADAGVPAKAIGQPAN